VERAEDPLETGLALLLAGTGLSLNELGARHKRQDRIHNLTGFHPSDRPLIFTQSPTLPLSTTGMATPFAPLTLNLSFRNKRKPAAGQGER
jgi:hypothetical protein